MPLPYDVSDAGGEGLICGRCAVKPPVFERARAALVYDSACRPMILALKHADRLQAVTPFARWMQRAGADVVAAADVIVPVPLHRWRLFARRYNQAALIAQALGRLAGRPTAVDALVRVRATASQGHKGRRQRFTNVAGAFAIHHRRRNQIAGRRVLLVDDVMTTGATVEACARVLLAAGASAVDVLTLARVAGPAG